MLWRALQETVCREHKVILTSTDCAHIRILYYIMYMYLSCMILNLVYIFKGVNCEANIFSLTTFFKLVKILKML